MYRSITFALCSIVRTAFRKAPEEAGRNGGHTENSFTNLNFLVIMISYFSQKRKSPVDGSLKYYATAGKVTPVKLAAIAETISKECTVTVHDVKAVLSALEEQLILAFQSGESVRFGDLGSFHVTLGSYGQETEDKVTSDTIKEIRVRFTKSAAMRSALKVKDNPKISFRLIAKNTGKVKTTSSDSGSSTQNG